MTWRNVLELTADRSVRSGSKESLAAAIGRGADLRMYTEFLFEEHIKPGGTDDERLLGPIREVIDFRETILVDGRHVGAITTQRQPLEPPFGFNGSEPKMSFFMYTGDGDQALANLVFAGVDGAPWPGERSLMPPTWCPSTRIVSRKSMTSRIGPRKRSSSVPPGTMCSSNRNSV